MKKKSMLLLYLKIFIECLLCARYCSRDLGHISQQIKNLCPLES